MNTGCVEAHITGTIRAGLPWKTLLGVPLAAVAVLLWIETTDLDRFVMGWFFDPVLQEFPLRDNEFLEVVMHYWAEYVVVLLGALSVVGYLLSFLIEALQPQRRVLLFLALSLALAPAAVTALKSISPKSCPWDLEQYGGLLPYTRLLERGPAGLTGGHCFPAGHASAGFALMAFFFVGRARGNRRHAWAGLAVGLAAGLVLGVGRMLQGAHFFSHMLWSAVVCWLVICLLAMLLLSNPVASITARNSS